MESATGISVQNTPASFSISVDKVSGTYFWGDPNLYIEIIEPLGHEAQRHDDEFKHQLSNLNNRLSREFTEKFCDPDGAIDWPRLVQSVSGNMEPE